MEDGRHRPSHHESFVPIDQNPRQQYDSDARASSLRASVCPGEPMKTRLVATLAVLVFLALSQSAHAQWSSDPAVNLPLADTPGADQVQPKVRALPNNQWWVSWFDSDPNSPPPA